MAKKNFEIKGFEEVKRNLNKELKKMNKGSITALTESAIFIRREMDMTTPTIPIDLGNLRASWYTNLIKFRFVNAIIMGFSANYAAFVHENIGATFKRPGSGAKFFEAALKRNMGKILKIFQKNTEV